MKRTEKELIAISDLSLLTKEEIELRTLYINSRKADRELALVQQENQKFEDKQEEKARVRKINLENARLEKEKRDGEMAQCAHMTGGEGLAGLFQGDGALYGSATFVQVLPTGEMVITCSRCTKEWRMPKKRDVLDRKMTISEYYKRANEFRDVLRWKRKTFEGINGEYMAASQFRIPALERQRQRDDEDFARFENEQTQPVTA